MTKPFGTAEMLARVRSALRRSVLATSSTRMIVEVEGGRRPHALRPRPRRRAPKKRERDPAQPAFLINEPGIGYRLRA